MREIGTLGSLLQQHCGCSMAELTKAPLTADQRETAAKIIRASMRPLDDAHAVGLLTKLSTLSPPRDDANEIAGLRFAAFAERLRDYPGDIVAAALDEWPDHCEFWPRWKDLKEILDVRRSERAALLGAIERPALPANDQRKAWVDEIAKTDPERAEILRKAIERRAS